MAEFKTRLYHCHKAKKNVHILEDYEIIDGKCILVRSQCPNYMSEDRASRCNGVNEHGFECGYANKNIETK
jgi:hypothetical protein